MFRRQADAIVRDAVHEIRTIRLNRDGDAARLVIALGDARGDAFAGILEHIGERPWDTSRPSPSNQTGALGALVVKLMAGLATRCRNTACCSNSWAFSRRITGEGMRAKEENSSTMRPISPTWRTMVSVHCWKISGSVTISAEYLRFSRSAESWIGVSGFLISWAMRRATSAQAAVRCAGDLKIGDVVEGENETVGAAGFFHDETWTLRVRGAPPSA